MSGPASRHWEDLAVDAMWPMQFDTNLIKVSFSCRLERTDGLPVGYQYCISYSNLYKLFQNKSMV